MAGHSHWAGIKHKKGRADKQRSKIFSKLSKEITVAAKLGSKDSDMNPRLRSAIQAARTANMPKDNIERAIKKSEVNKNLNYNNITYEGFGIFNSKNNKKVAVINLMGNIFMKKCDDVFEAAKKFIQSVKLKEDADFIVVDMHGEITSEKMAMGYLFDGKVTMFVGTHTHVPTSDYRIMEKGTAYQTDLGMCGDYNSVIGMNRDNSLKKFFKDPSATKHYPALGEATISGLMVIADNETGLANKVEPIVLGKYLENRI